MKLEARVFHVSSTSYFISNADGWTQFASEVCNNQRTTTAGSLHRSQNYVIFSNYTHAPSDRACECHYVASLNNQYQPLPFIVQVYALYYYRLNGQYNPIPLAAPSAARCPACLSLFLRQRRAHKHVPWMASFIHPLRPYVSRFLSRLTSIHSFHSRGTNDARINFTFISAILIITAVYYSLVGRNAEYFRMNLLHTLE